ncbi:hypothetical protein Syun_031279 [Stephania yunnanensis]|uniref:Uncharacterized protein n=1 Tax=Stephania yunnanensis TaxID=152371 RepID=A0AAP0DZK3_9MAGN
MAVENAPRFQTGFRNDREAAGSRFASADELHTSHDQQLQKILRWLRAQVTLSSSMSAALVIQAGCVFTVHNPPEKLLVQAGPAVTEVTHVRAAIVPHIPETPAEDTPSIPIDTGVKATVEDVALAYIDGRRQMVCSLLGGHGGAQLVTEEPSSSRRSPARHGGAQFVVEEPNPTE